MHSMPRPAWFRCRTQFGFTSTVIPGLTTDAKGPLGVSSIPAWRIASRIIPDTSRGFAYASADGAQRKSALAEMPTLPFASRMSVIDHPHPIVRPTLTLLIAVPGAR